MVVHPKAQHFGRARTVVAAFCLAVFAAILPAAAQERVALVVGNSAYQHARTLPNPANDAQAISDKLEALGFTVTTTIDADLPRLRDQVRAFGDAARGAEIALVFFAGHGIQVAGENYLLPVDARIASRDDLPGATLPAGEVFEEFVRASPQLAVLILDACRDNPFVSAVSTTRGLATGAISAHAFVTRDDSAGMVISFAAAPGAVAFDGKDGNSPFTTALLRWLDQPGLEMAAMFREVRKTVLELTRKNQVPWLEEALLREVYLNPGEPAAPPSRDELFDRLKDLVGSLLAEDERLAGEGFVDVLEEAEGSPERPEPANPGFERESMIWIALRDSSEPELFERFLDRFPDGRFAERARERLRELHESPSPATPDYLAHVTAPAELAAPEAAPPEASPAAPTPAGIEAGLGLDAEALAAVQVLLQQAGFYGGPIDSDFGPGTRRGIARFQSGEALEPTEHLDRRTLDHLVRRAAGPVLRGDLPEARRDAVHRVAAVAQRGPGARPEVVQAVPISRNDSVHAYWRSIADDFEASRPGTRVEIDPMPGTDYQAQLLALLGSEDPPEILYTWGGGHLDALREAGFARDLTDEMAAGWAFEFKPGVLQNYVADGRIYGVPTHVSLVSLYVNRAVMERAGIEIARLETWDGFLDVVRELQAQGITPIAIGGGDRWPFQLFYGKLVQTIGGRAAFEDALAGRGAGFEAPAFREAGDRLAGLAALDPFQAEALTMSDGDAAEVFAAGDAAMMVTGNWRLAKMRFSWPGGRQAMLRDLVRLDFPRIGDPRPGVQTYGGVDGLAVRAGAPDSAVEFLRVLASRSAQETMTELVSNVPAISSADLAIEDPFLGDTASRLTESTYHQLFLDQEVGPLVGEVVTDAAVRLGTGEITGEDAAAAIQRAWVDYAGLGEGAQAAPLIAR